MTIAFNILGLVAICAAAAVFAQAQSAVHEIEGLILLLIAAVLLAGGGICEALAKAWRELRTLTRNAYPDEIAAVEKKEREKRSAEIIILVCLIGIGAILYLVFKYSYS
jgi:hypothetical protein